ncbi:MAG: hypothetical protein AAGF95_09485 [Chloroflexota bacterium]
MPNGLSVEDLTAAVKLVGQQFAIEAIGVAAYDLQYDSEGRTVETAIQLVEMAVETVSG